ncbi:Bfa1p KNAG_0B00310 [Huiozyma naganishii CBS 8797]|uniref:Uncharacterized protein n=1 Tax=Huiozyma naganishii (strain ATCC MYA-139 / BCRC 22969 / CBS 8797 / KCTC 17520 / NBRC 10181 / NCYC 3082 / Yp74L-3) TaxID=1071383 RepID=J7R126_HUIN7|nr:hypothetical protein KNAG_0B00310 [Kazachstania naganishii CBS 8797]CCK68480.1 hypothetical protein KNAG_0B00310 [Kazachstania naganishii CBS 8797]
MNRPDYDSSFEELETSYTKEIGQRRPTGSIMKERIRQPQMEPTASSTTSSDATIFSDGVHTQGYTNEDPTRPDDSGDQYLTKFKDFRFKTDNFDEAIKNQFSKVAHPKSSPTRRSNEFAQQFHRMSSLQNNKKVGTYSTGRSNAELRHPRSMSELKINERHKTPEFTKSSIRIRSQPSLKGSKSYGNLKSTSNGNFVRFKKSMPNLNPIGSPIVEVNDEYADENIENLDDTVIIEPLNSYDYMKQFKESPMKDENFDFADDQDFNFNFDDDALQPQFLANSVKRRQSPKEYNKHEYLDTNEVGSLPYRGNRNSSGPFRTGGDSNSPTSRIRTIKQSIDDHIPTDNLESKSVPQKRWVEDPHILNEFPDRDTIDANLPGNPFLIKNNQHRSISDSIDEGMLQYMKTRSNSNNPKVVGSMVFDEKNQRWVSVSGADSDPFSVINDQFDVPQISKGNRMLKKSSTATLRGQPSRRSLRDGLGIPIAGHRISVGKQFGDSDLEVDPNVNYTINSKTLEKFYHEENRWNKKVGAWFILRTGQLDHPDESFCSAGEISDDSLDPARRDVSSTSKDSKDFMYEIRKMVLNSTRS